MFLYLPQLFISLSIYQTKKRDTYWKNSKSDLLYKYWCYSIKKSWSSGLFHNFTNLYFFLKILDSTCSICRNSLTPLLNHLSALFQNVFDRRRFLRMLIQCQEKKSWCITLRVTERFICILSIRPFFWHYMALFKPRYLIKKRKKWPTFLSLYQCFVNICKLTPGGLCMLSPYAWACINLHIYIYIYICVCVCVCSDS